MNIVNKGLLKKIYNELKLDSKVSQIELARKYNVSERTIRRYYKILKDNGCVKYIINGKDRKWKVINDYSII